LEKSDAFILLDVLHYFSEEKQDQIAHCHLTGNNMDYFGEAKTSSLYASIDQGIVKIEKQIQKHKEIIKDKRA